MKLALFTSNQPRHISLIKRLSELADELLVVCEVTTVFPGLTQDFYNKSDIMKNYFEKVQQSETNIFGKTHFLNANVRMLPIKMGDINNLPIETFKLVEDCDFCVVFGASWIKGYLCDLLISKKAINIHMGVSPYYRGAACNFWALYDQNPHLVGATLHYISKGLDSGDMIMHALPRPAHVSGFTLGMMAVDSAQLALCDLIRTGNPQKIIAVKQNKTDQIRYSRRLEFNDEVASYYLSNEIAPDEIFRKCSERDLTKFLNPYIS